MHFLLILFSIIAIVWSVIVFSLVFLVILSHLCFPHSFNPFLFFTKFWHLYLCIFLVTHLVQNDTIPSKTCSKLKFLLNFSFSVCNQKARGIRSHRSWDDLMRQVPAGQLATGQSEADMGQAAHTSQYLFSVGQSNKTLLSSEFLSRSPKLIEEQSLRRR